MTETPRGRFCWYELMTTDPEAARAFYTELTGWTTQAWDQGPTPYTMWMNGDTPVGGVMRLPPEAEGAPPSWIAYVSTPDVDATVAAATGKGASTLWGPMDLPMVGRFAGLEDPQGAVVALLQPASAAPGHDGPARQGEFSWHELATDDPEAAWSFYAGLFDWSQTDALDMGEMGKYYMFGRGAHPIGAMFRRPPQIPVSNWLLYVKVPDVDAAAQRVPDLGGQVLTGPMEVPGGDRIVQCMDPQGAAFAMHASAASPAGV